MPPVDTIQNDVEKILGRPVKAAQPRLEARPKDDIKNDVESILGRQVKPYQQSNVGQLEPPPGKIVNPETGDEFKDYGPKYGAMPPAAAWLYQASEAPSKFAKWFGNMAAGGGDLYKKGWLGNYLSVAEAPMNPLPLLNKITSYGAAPKGIEEDIRPEEYADWVKERPWLMHSVELLRHAGRSSSEIVSDPTTWLFVGSGAVRPGLKLLIDSGFSALQGYGAWQSGSAAYQKAQSGDYWGMAEDISSTLLNGAFALTAANELRPKNAIANWRLSTTMMEAEKISRKDFGKSWTNLDPTQRDAVTTKITDTLKKPVYQKIASELNSRALLQDIQDVQKARNEARAGQPMKLPERLRSLEPTVVEAMVRLADEHFPEGRTTGKPVKVGPPVDVKALTPESLRAMPDEDLARTSRYFSSTPDTPESVGIHKLVEQERLRRLALEGKNKQTKDGVNWSEASTDRSLGGMLEAENARSEREHKEFLEGFGKTEGENDLAIEEKKTKAEREAPLRAQEAREAEMRQQIDEEQARSKREAKVGQEPERPKEESPKQVDERAEKAGQGLRDLIALNNREVVRKTVDRMIANAPEKRPSERQPALLEGQPLTPDQQFDEMVESVKAERGQKEAADARRVLDEHERLMNLIRQGRDTAGKEAADQAAREAEARPKVVDRRRVAFEPPPESDRLKFEAKPHDEVAILEGMPQGRDEAFDRRRDELLEEIKREQEARLTESLARLRRLASKTQGILDRSLEGYIERTENEARDRGFKIVDLRGTRGAQEPAAAAPPGKPTEAATIPAPSAAEPAASPAPATPESSAAVPPDLKAPPKKLAKPPKEEPRAAIPSTLKGIAGSPFTLNVEGHNYEVRAIVVPGESLKISHNPQTFQITPGGAADEARWGRRLQPRYYETDKDAQSSVIADSTPETFNPHKIFAVDPTTTIGPPVVLPDGTVMGGNSRAMKVMRMYNMGHGDIVRNGLVNGLKNHLDFGIKADDVPPETEKPILVWELTNPPRDAKNLAIMGDDLNRPPTRGLDEVQQGMALSNRISDETVDWMSNQFETLGDNASMRDIIRDNEPYLISVMIKDGVFPRGQLSELVDTRSGKLTDKAKNLIVSAMRGKAFDDPAILAKTSPALLQKLDRALPQLIRMKARDDNWDMRKYVNEAIKAHNAAASVGDKLEYWIHPERNPELEKEPMLGMEPLKPLEAISPITEALAYKLDQSGLSFNKALRAYLNDPMMFEEKSQGRMTYGEKKPLPWDSFNAYFGDEFGIHTDIGDWLNMEPPPVELPVKPIKEKRSTEPSNIKERLLVDDYKTHGIPREQWAGLIEAERTRDEVSRRQKSELSPEQEKMLAQGKSTNEILAMGNKSEEPPAPLEPPKKAKKAKAAKVEPPPVEAKAEEPPPPQVVRQRANAFAALERGLSDSELKHLAFENGLELTESGKLKFVDQRGGGGNYTVPKKDFVDWILGNKQGDDPLSYSKDPEWIELIGRARKIAGDEEPPPPLEAAKGSPTLDYAEEIKKIPDKDLFSLQHRTQLEGKEDSETKAKLKAMQAELERREKLNGGNWGDDNTVITKDDAAKLRESIRKKTLGGGLKAGLDPTLLLDMAKLGAFHFEAGAREFIRWSDNMVSDIGDWIRPHLRDVWTRLPIIAREEAQRKIQAGTPPAIAEKLRARARLFSEIERKPLGLVDLSGKEVTDVQRKEPDAGARRDEPRRLDRPPDEAAERPGYVEPEPHEAAGPAGRSRRAGRELAETPEGEPKPRREAKPSPEVKPLAEIKPVGMEAPKGADRPSVVSESKWRKDLYRWKMPESMPPPTVSLSPAIDSKLHDFQSMLVSRAVSTLIDNDAVIVGAPKGSGKTYMGSGIVAEMLDRMGDKRDSATVLILAPSKPLGKKWTDTMSQFGVEVNPLPPGEGAPSKPGAYFMTYAGAIRRPGIEKFNWDIVLADESQWARRWYAEKEAQPGKSQAFTTQGKLTKDVTSNASKAIYVSATPFHTALEVGYMEKLGLWKPGEFEKWAKQFGVTKDENGWNVPPNPQRLVKLWSQLVEQGRLVGMEHNLHGQSINFAVVPLKPEHQQEIKNIVKAFQMAQTFFQTKGKPAMRKVTSAQAVTFMKAYLERTRLDAVIDLTKRLNDQGWKVGIFSESRSPVQEIYNFLKPADEYYGGEIAKLLPKLRGVAETLQEGLGGGLAEYMGPHSTERTEQLEKFQSDALKNIYATYAAGGVGVDMHDTVGDKPRAAIYLGPPWSGMMLDQALGRMYRVGSMSDGYHLFVSSNAEPEIRLMLGKVAPRLQSLRAMVNGIARGDALVEGFRDAASYLQYTLGEEESPDLSHFQRVMDTKGVANYKSISPPSAKESMNKPMKLEREGTAPEPTIVTGNEPPPALKPPPKRGGGSILYSGIDPEVAKEALKKTAEDVSKIASKVGQAIGNEFKGKSEFVNDDPVMATAVAEIRRLLAKPETKKTVQDTFPSLYDKDAFERMASISSNAAAISTPHNPEGAIVDSWRDDLGWLDGVQRIAGHTMNAAETGWMYLVRSGQRNIEKLGGEPGKQITYMIKDYQAKAGNYSGKWKLKIFDMVKKYDLVDPTRMTNLFDAVERDATPIDDRIAKARDEMRALMGEVADLARAKGVQVEVIEPSGEKRYFPFPVRDESYMPRIYDEEVFRKGSKKHEALVQKIAARRGITDMEVRSYLERLRAREVPLAGNLERAREFDLDEHEKTLAALSKYIENAGEVISRSEVFGQRRGKLESTILDVRGPSAKDTFDRQEEIRQIMDQLLSRKIPSERARVLSNLISNWTIFSKMTTSAIPMMTHTMKAAVMTSDKAFFRALYDTIRDYPDAMRSAVRSGAISDHVRGDILRDLGGTGDIKSNFLKFYQIYRIDRWSRILSDGAARNWLEHEALPALMKEPDNPKWNRLVKDKFLLTDAQVKDAVSKGFWSQDALDRAGKRAADATQGTYDPTELPPWWRSKGGTRADDSLAAVVRSTFMLKGYVYRNGNFFKEWLWDEAKAGNFKPWIPVLTLLLPAGEVINGLRDYANGKKKYMEDTVKLLTGQSDFETGLAHLARDFGFLVAASYMSMLMEAALNKVGLAREAVGPFLSDVFVAGEESIQAGKDFLDGNVDAGLKKLWKIPTRTVRPLRPLAPTPTSRSRQEELGLEPISDEYKVPNEYRQVQ